MIANSIQTAEQRRQDPHLIERMQTAARGQSPEYLLISPIDRAQQDLQLLSFQQGDAFRGTRVPRTALPSASESLFLFGGPGSYSRHFHNRRAVIMTFESDEESDVINTSIEHVARHPDLTRLPIVALSVDYDRGQACLIPHGIGHARDIEDRLLSQLRRPQQKDSKTLVITCSDSRVIPPPTPRGLAMSIHTLGGYLPPFSEKTPETVLLDGFLRDWLAGVARDNNIIVLAHGDFGGQACGACMASMRTAEELDATLGVVISTICNDVAAYERGPPKTPQDRALSIAHATAKNLLEYPAMRSTMRETGTSRELVQILLSDTVTNVLRRPPV